MSIEAATTEEGRVLACTTCGDDVLVYELPREWIQEELYRCGLCQRGEGHPPQLELLQGMRSEAPAYNPAQSSIPF